MGFFGGNTDATAPPVASGRASSSSDTRDVSGVKAAVKPTKGTKALTDAEKLAQQKEAEEVALAQLVAGAPDVEAQQRAQKRFLGSNTRHMYVDGLLGTAVYTFSGLQHITGQSNALTLLSMWAAGTTFLINAGLRHYLNDITRGTMPATPNAVAKSDVATGTETKTAKPKTSSPAEAAAARSAQPSGTPATPSMVASAGLLVDYDTQRRNVFQLEAVASWVWMLAALQQFRVHKRLRWCGYSSWSGLGCVAYYSVRYLYNILVE